MKLKFVSDAVYNGELLYTTGQELELDDSKGFATRWIKRGVAVPVYKEEKIEATKPEVIKPVPAAKQKDKPKTKNKYGGYDKDPVDIEL